MELAALVQENEQLQQRVSALEAEIRLWRQKVDRLLQRLYGTSSEKLPEGQLQLLMAGLSQPPSLPAAPPSGLLEKASSASPRPNKPVRQGLPKNLETVEIRLEPEEIKAAPQDWKKIGEEITEELDYTPARFFRRLYIRPQYVRKPQPSVPVPNQAPSDLVSQVLAGMEGAKSVIIAPLPPRLIEKGYPGPGLLAHIVISKYEDHLPLYRQEKIYRQRHGLKLCRQTLAEWVAQTGFWLQPIYNQMKAGLLAAGYLQADETPIRYLDPDQPGKAQQGYLWVYSAPGSDVLFDWKTTRRHEVPAEFLRSFQGTLQTDAYAAYLRVAEDRKGEIQLAGCWAHVRRNFVEALKEDRRVGWFVRQIGLLYGVEKKSRAARAGPRLRTARRAAEARPVLERLRRALEKMAVKILPKSGFGEAISYARNHWQSLIRYATDGRLEIDNNLIENAIRPTAVGKKNFLFIGHPEAGWYSAVIYSILGSCHRHGINPHEYLTEVLTRLPNMTNQQIGEITPAAWAKAKKAQLRSAAR